MSWYGNIKSFGTCYILKHTIIVWSCCVNYIDYGRGEEMVERQFNSIEEDGRKAYWLMKIHCFDLMNTVRYIFMKHQC